MPKSLAKIKGCYQCSQRRIDCDRTVPKCLKCKKKGVECTGLGLRYRFNPGVAARGRYMGKELPVPPEHDIAAVRSRAPVQLPFIAWNTDGEKPAGSKHFGSHQRSESTSKASINLEQTCSDTHKRAHDEELETSTVLITTEDQILPLATEQNPLFINTKCIFPGTNLALWNRDFIPHSFETHDHVTRMLFANFSETVAKSMVIFDDQSNEFRMLLLPMAATSDLVRNAVFAASAYQLASKNSSFAAEALRYQTAAINSLTQHPDVAKSEREVVLAAVTILLVSEIVSGGSGQFQVLYKMLKHCISIETSASATESNSLMSFLRDHLETVEFLIQPFLSEKTAVWNHNSQLLGQLKFLENAVVQHPGRMGTIRLLGQAFFHASEIYLNRAIHNISRAETISNVEELKVTVDQLPVDGPGEHILVWVYFIGAAESSTRSQQDFFRSRLQRLYSTTGFSNIISSLRILDHIWANSETKWTQLILDQAFIM
ncbi:hypothetical protein VTL71DRAFT_4866 [Oculimacula yallundae]|uniref:Zn(2)-C6 fungal-type domain-containing protein n=1 Tax=Oculimacula yallundae TaxID=86028 RepID=A0ABR4C367_9HELO